MNRSLNRLFLTLALAGSMMAETIVPDGTPIKLRLNEPLSSGRNQVGQGVSLSVAEDVSIGDRVVIEAGARATGLVTVAEPKRMMGRAGKLDFIPEKIQMADGRLLNLRATQQGFNGKGKSITSGIIAAGIAVAFWPAAPFALMIKGKDVDIPPGATFTCFTDAKFVIADSPHSGSLETGHSDGGKARGEAVLTITADTDAADIELDGAFVGQTPAKLSLTAGTHRLAVRDQGQVWERTLQFEAGSTITLKAHLSTEVPKALARAAQNND